MDTQRIMIVDDKEDNLYLLRVLLQAHGYEVSESGNGAEALDKARQNPPDIIIADILMPVMDGFALCREWKHDESLRRIPFVFYTATYTDDRDRKFALSLGAERFLIKPTEPNDFVAIIRDVLRGAVNKQDAIPDDQADLSLPPSPEPNEEGTVFLKQYNETLIRKLENKMETLEQLNRVLQEDIAERKKMEQILRESAMLQRAITNTAKDAIIMMNSQEIITFWNPEAETVFGYSYEEVCGKKVHELLAPEKYHDSIRTMMPFFLASGGGEAIGKTVELEAIRKDGKIIPIELSLASTQLQSEWHAVAVIRDITERRRADEQKASLEAQLRKSQRLETIGTLAGGIAHDFNNILVPILICSEMALKNHADETLLRDDLETIHEAANRAKELIKHILTFSRQHEQERIVTTIAPVIKEAMKLIRSTLPSTIRINDSVSHECMEIKILADPSQIHQVLMNLCTNAAHAMRGNNGILSVTLARSEVNAETLLACPHLHCGPHLLLRVQDTGQGMKSETMEHIFEPFFTTKEIGEGTGLGLAVVHGIVRNHDGDITVQSTVGKGTVFEVYLPITNTLTETKIEKQVQIEGGNERILVVDDDEVVCKIIGRILASMGYSITTRTSSTEAFELFKNDPSSFDMVLTDQTMPQLTGDNLSRKLLEIRPDLPIILMTGYSTMITAESFKKLGNCDYIMKPIISNDLAQAIRRLLEKANFRK